jgi:hypothetical protein
MNDAPTPRSDAAELTEPYEIRSLGFCVVRIDDARQLERELAEARRERDEASDSYVVKVNQLTAERALADRLADGLTNPAINVAMEALDAWKEAREQHAEAFSKTHN